MATCSTSGFCIRSADDHQRLVDRDAELLVLEYAPELGLRRLRGVVHHDVHRADQAVAGAKRRRR